MWTQCWLNYSESKGDSQYADYFSCVYIEGFERDKVVDAAIEEITRAAKEMYDVEIHVGLAAGAGSCETQHETSETAYAKSATKDSDSPNGIVLRKVGMDEIPDEGYRIRTEKNACVIEASGSNGLIYGVFRFISLVRLGEFVGVRGCTTTDACADTQISKPTDITEIPKIPLRMLDHWDNMDGSIERGYSGNSFFFENKDVVINERTKDYARLLASMAINAVVINNVNVGDIESELVNEKFIDKVAKLADLFECYGVKLFLCLNYAMPIDQEPKSADPLDENVIKWWEAKMKYVYDHIPNFGGFLVKADSEGRPGPFTYGRTQADGANMLARAIKPYGGLIIWRCFVYNCQQDWRDLKTDRAKAGFDSFSQLDGEFLDNVILQIKNGPVDFQPREPVSPLFGGMPRTNEMLEVQIAQEYTGHQIDLCYLIPWFKEILNFNTYMGGRDVSVADVIGGMAAVTNTGNDENWTGNDLAAANLYGYGRLAYDTDLEADEIAREWIGLTFPGLDGEGRQVILNMLMGSWATYEKYTAPLGIGWMVRPDGHYGPSVDGFEYDRWGTYHRADLWGIGVERGPEGTGMALQYNSPWSEIYSDKDKTPDELMLFFHKMPYTHVLRSGKTIIQHIYDTHFEGYEDVVRMQEAFAGLEGKINDRAFRNISERLELQRLNAREWRDVVNSYFYRKCGIPDEKGRKIY